MSGKKAVVRFDYAGLLGRVKDCIRQSQARAVLAANAELIRLYWDIGRLLVAQQGEQGWGAAVIPRLARDLRNLWRVTPCRITLIRRAQDVHCNPHAAPA